MNCLSTKIPNFCSCDLVKTGKVNVICMVAFCQFICLYNTLYCGLFRQSVIAICTMLLVKINGGWGGVEATASVPSTSAASAAV